MTSFLQCLVSDIRIDMLDQIRLVLNRLQSKHPTYQTLFQVSNVLGLLNVRLDSLHFEKGAEGGGGGRKLIYEKDESARRSF